MTSKIIKMVDVKSSSIKKIGYFRRTLLVEFLNGDKYSFGKVPRSTFDAFSKANSYGNFFVTAVKPVFNAVKC